MIAEDDGQAGGCAKPYLQKHTYQQLAVNPE